MKDFNKIVIVEESEHQQFYLNVGDNYQIEYRKEAPSICEILRSKKTIYKLARQGNTLNKLKREIVKALNKKWLDTSNFEMLFKIKFEGGGKDLIILTHDVSINNIIIANLPSEWLPKTVCFSLNCSFLRNDKKNKAFLRPLQTIERELLNDSDRYPICSEFEGNLLLINQVNSEIVKLVRQKFPKAKIVVKYVDYIDFLAKVYGKGSRTIDYSAAEGKLERDFKDRLKVAIDNMKSYGAVMVSYSRNDAQDYNLIYEPNGVSIRNLSGKSSVSQTSFYCFFAGNSQGTRSKKLYNLAQRLVANHVHTKYILVGIENDYEQKFRELAKSEYFELSTNRVPYHKILEEQTKSHFTVDLYRFSPNEGYSYRIPESLALSKKIITDRTAIKNELFYSPEIILCSEDLSFSDEELRAFLKSKRADYPDDVIVPFDVENQSFWPNHWR